MDFWRNGEVCLALPYRHEFSHLVPCPFLRAASICSSGFSPLQYPFARTVLVEWKHQKKKVLLEEWEVLERRGEKRIKMSRS